MLETVMNFLCIVPVYNEEERLQELFKNIEKINDTKKNLDFLIFNNGSTDSSRKIILNSNFKFLESGKNYGVGFALIEGFKYAQKNGYEAVIHLAGNGKMKPEEIVRFTNKIENENFDFVNGSRFLPSGNYSTNPIQRVVLIKILTSFISLIYKKKITDATCGFRGFKTSLFKNLINFLDNKNFYTYKYEYYTLGKILIKKNIKFTEVGVTMDYRKKNYSKITPIIDWIPIISGWIGALLDGKKI